MYLRDTWLSSQQVQYKLMIDSTCMLYVIYHKHCAFYIILALPATGKIILIKELLPVNIYMVSFELVEMVN